jgi:polyisoprenoid-binding protein YceI
MKTTLISLSAVIALIATTGAAPLTFDFKDPKGVNNALFRVDAPLEAVNGTASGITGTITFDPENPATTAGKIVVASSSLVVPNGMMRAHLLGVNWLQVEKYPQITFESKSIKNVKTTANVTTADVTGAFTLKDVSKELTIPVKLTYLKDKLGDRVPKASGDLLVLRSTFTIKRSDFNLQAHQFEDKVSDEIEITLSIAGAAPK